MKKNFLLMIIFNYYCNYNDNYESNEFEIYCPTVYGYNNEQKMCIDFMKIIKAEKIKELNYLRLYYRINEWTKEHLDNIDKKETKEYNEKYIKNSNIQKIYKFGVIKKNRGEVFLIPYLEEIKNCAMNLIKEYK